MDKMDQVRQYEICKDRGHEPDNIMLMSMPPWNICKHCGTQYRYESTLIERNYPDENQTKA